MLKKLLVVVSLSAFVPLAAYAQGAPLPPPSQNPMPEAVIELKDGTKITHNANGTMFHEDGKGKRLSMPGKMEAKDGSAYIMKNGYIWKRVETGSRPHTP